MSTLARLTSRLQLAIQYRYNVADRSSKVDIEKDLWYAALNFVVLLHVIFNSSHTKDTKKNGQEKYGFIRRDLRFDINWKRRNLSEFVIKLNFIVKIIETEFSQQTWY